MKNMMIHQSGSVNSAWTKILDDSQLGASIGSPLLFARDAAPVKKHKIDVRDINREPFTFSM
jgi:hypothetical protein